MDQKNYTNFAKKVKYLAIGILLMGLGVTIITLSMDASDGVNATYNLFGVTIIFDDQADFGFVLFLLLYAKWIIASLFCYLITSLAGIAILKNSNAKEPLHAKEPLPEKGEYCTVCNTKNPAGRSHCVSCGSKLSGKTKESTPTYQETKTVSCPTCSSKNPAGRAYCTSCGSKLN